MKPPTPVWLVLEDGTVVAEDDVFAQKTSGGWRISVRDGSIVERYGIAAGKIVDLLAEEVIFGPPSS